MTGFERFAIRLLLSMSMEEARETLGFPPGYVPGPSEINKAYRRKAIENHPDRGGSHEKMVEINVAKEILEGKRHDRYRPPPKPAKSPEDIKKEEEIRAKNIALRLIDESALEVSRALESVLSPLDLFKNRLHIRDFFADDLADALDKMQDDAEKVKKTPVWAKADALIDSLLAKSVRLGKKYLSLLKEHGEVAAAQIGLGGAKPVTYDTVVELMAATKAFVMAFKVMHQDARKLMQLINMSSQLPMEWDDLFHRPFSIMDSFMSDFAGIEPSLNRGAHNYSEALSHASQRITAALEDVNPEYLKKFTGNWKYPDDFNLARDLVNGKVKTADVEPTTPKKTRKPRGKPTEESVMLRIEKSPYHFLPFDDVKVNERPVIKALMAKGLVRLMEPTGRFPERFVVTSKGSHALRTFNARLIARVAGRFMVSRLNLDNANNVSELLIDSADAMGSTYDLSSSDILEPLEVKLLSVAPDREPEVKRTILDLYNDTHRLFTLNDILLNDTGTTGREHLEARHLEHEIERKVKSLYRGIRLASDPALGKCETQLSTGV